MIRILFLTANPLNENHEPALKLYREFESIDDKIQLSKYRNNFELIPRFSLSVSRLQEYIVRFKPHIIHFSGHGTTAGELVFEDKYGDEQIADTASIKNIFGILHKGIRCVLLNSCYSARQARLISNYVDCVIGMTNAIIDHAATEFATNFYFGLGSGLSVRDAYDMAKNQVSLLYIKDIDGKAIDVKKQSNLIKLISKSNLDPSKLKLIVKRRLSK
jgi:hypothetical protein